MNRLVSHGYYALKPWIPKSIRYLLRSWLVRYQRRKHRATWPIDPRAGTPPKGWCGWPDGKRFAFVLTHDVETDAGRDRCSQVVDMEERYGFRSAFNFVAERYELPAAMRAELESKGFEVGVHGLFHDGKLYRSRKTFLERADRINHYLRDWGAVGFRSPLMHRNLDWIHDLEIEYDASTFDTDPLEPQPAGVGTIFPFHASLNGSTSNSYVELPYTLPQDSTLFVFLGESSIEIWKRKLAWLAEHGGMAMVITHPDYMNFDGQTARGEYSASLYAELLEHVETEYAGEYWPALPRDIARFWKKNMENTVNTAGIARVRVERDWSPQESPNEHSAER